MVVSNQHPITRSQSLSIHPSHDRFILQSIHAVLAVMVRIRRTPVVPSGEDSATANTNSSNTTTSTGRTHSNPLEYLDEHEQDALIGRMEADVDRQRTFVLQCFRGVGATAAVTSLVWCLWTEYRLGSHELTLASARTIRCTRWGHTALALVQNGWVSVQWSASGYTPWRVVLLILFVWSTAGSLWVRRSVRDDGMASDVWFHQCLGGGTLVVAAVAVFLHADDQRTRRDVQALRAARYRYKSL
jgi:hypothetical protein